MKLSTNASLAIKTSLLFGLLAAFSLSSQAAPTGSWDIRWKTGPRPNDTQLAMLEIKENGEATIDGTPTSVQTQGDNVSFELQRFSFRGPVRISFSGTLKDHLMEGQVKPANNDATYPFTATKVGSNPAPRDISGVWLGVGFGGWQPREPKLTPAGQARAERSSRFDDESLRCVSVGLGQLFSWPYLMELVDDDQQVLFLYEGEREIRRVYLDGREHPEIGDGFDNPMGYSTGHWEGRTLVIKTTNLTPSLLANSGGLHHMGRETVIDERYTLSDDGEYIRAELVLADPLTLQEPIRNSRVLRRTDEEMAPFHCDPYSFFRQLHQEENLIEEYFQHKSMFEEG